MGHGPAHSWVEGSCSFSAASGAALNSVKNRKSPVRTSLFQVHFWVGALIGAYVFVMSVSGSMIVYRGKLFEMGWSVERIVDLHENWLTGSTGRAANGIGAICLTLLCLTGAAIW